MIRDGRVITVSQRSLPWKDESARALSDVGRRKGLGMSRELWNAGVQAQRSNAGDDLLIGNPRRAGLAGTRTRAVRQS